MGHHSHSRSLQCRHVDAGSCNGCEQELNALTGSFYDMQHVGLDIVASPRHADALIVTGPVSDTMMTPLRAVWAALPRPKRLVALGDCAAGYGVFQGAYATRGGVEGSMRPPDVVIRGCPPTPAEILQGLTAVMDTLLEPSSFIDSQPSADLVEARRIPPLEQPRGDQTPADVGEREI
ncbi:NADH-quinone oxidoreductase subunit B family protein [Sulfobacillus sp. hq2]|uniref:NADH-quinone oxidoreductase subunit B family protein n=1 Tax=Sulfobacillus TaxID=28033 RepID=UPI000CD30577|nr:hypothetical protein [Sulfobacillus sp. hq2]POB11324.1 hypothetical protein CO251_05275 [Sulfobacillus sp. hq2]